MKIILSPAKSLNLNFDVPHNQYSNFFFTKEANTINKKLNQLKPKQLISLMKISDNLAQLNYTRNQKRTLENLTLQNAKQAIYTFDGDVYDGFDVYTLAAKNINFMQENIRILSGLYGLLKPLDLIQPYRMEMGKPLVVGKNKNLYDFWQPKIAKQLQAELDINEPLINLASQEYFSAIDKKTIKNPIITIDFKEIKNGEPKIISFFAKKARGLMARYIVDNRISIIENLKNFDIDNYKFDTNLSSENKFIFVR